MSNINVESAYPNIKIPASGRIFKRDHTPSATDIALGIIVAKGNCDLVIHGCTGSSCFGIYMGRLGAECPIHTDVCLARGGGRGIKVKLCREFLMGEG